MRKFTCLLLILLPLLFSNCKKSISGIGDPVNKVLDVPTSSGIIVGVNANVEVRQSPDYKVEIFGQQNILDIIEPLLVNNELIIQFKDGVKLGHYDQLSIKYSSPTIKKLQSEGEVNITSNYPIISDTLISIVNGNGNINISQITGGYFYGGINGYGTINASGTCSDLKILSQGKGEMNLSTLTVQNASVVVKGDGKFYINALQKLDVIITGSAEIYYKGSPIITQQISGSGILKQY